MKHFFSRILLQNLLNILCGKASFKLLLLKLSLYIDSFFIDIRFVFIILFCTLPSYNLSSFLKYFIILFFNLKIFDN